MRSESDKNMKHLDMYEKWRIRVKDEIEQFVSSLPEQVQGELDYSPASLNAVERWLIERFPTSEATYDEAGSRLLAGAIFYVGETYRKNVGGYWNVHLAEFEPDYEYGESPVIEGFFSEDKEAAVCPGFIVMDAIRHRLGTELSQNLEGLILFISRSKS